MARKKESPKPATPAEQVKPTAIVLVGSSVALSKEQKSLLSEALRRGEETRNTVEDALVAYGRWLLVHVFDNDASAALDGKRENPVWREILQRAGGPTLRLSRRFLYVAIAIAAHDKRIADDSWRLLEPGRKELLLPLGDESAMREAAKHVVSMKLSQRATRAYVRSQLAEAGNATASRVTGKTLQARLSKLRSDFTAPPFTKKLEQLLPSLAVEEKAALRKELAALRGWVASLEAQLRKASKPQ